MLCQGWHWQPRREACLQGNHGNSVSPFTHQMLNCQIAEVVSVQETSKVYGLGSTKTNKGLKLKYLIMYIYTMLFLALFLLDMHYKNGFLE